MRLMAIQFVNSPRTSGGLNDLQPKRAKPLSRLTTPSGYVGCLKFSAWCIGRVDGAIES